MSEGNHNHSVKKTFSQSEALSLSKFMFALVHKLAMCKEQRRNGVKHAK